MTRLSLLTLASLCVSLGVAWQLGGTLGAGVVAGFGVGALLSGLGVLYQRHVLFTRPERALAAFVLGFLAKALALVLGGLALRFIDAAAALADWQSFLVAFAAAVVVLLPVGSWEAVREWQTRRGEIVAR